VVVVLCQMGNLSAISSHFD